MKIVKSSSDALRVALLSSASGLVLMVAPGMAATIVVDAPDNNGVTLNAVDDALINNSDISIPDGQGSAVFSDDPVTSILNNAGATITGSNNGSGVFIDDTIGTFTNHGTITTNGFDGVGASGLITTFVNTGTITSTDPAGGNGVSAQGGFGSFTNSGEITGTRTGVSTDADTGTFTNSGTITGQSDNGVGFFSGSGVGSFTNTSTGVITGAQHGVTTDGGATLFTNAGEITGQGGNGVGFFNNSGVGTFNNSGTITGSQNGVTTDDGATLFTNSGTITGQGGAGVGFFNGSGVTTFSNSGTIAGLDGSGVAVEGAVTSFSNLAGGTISGTSAGFDPEGVFFGSSVQSFFNAGLITGDGNAVNVDNGSAVGAFTNTGTLSSTAFSAVRLSGDVTTFSNSGAISSVEDSGVSIEGVVGTFTNSGTISGTGINGGGSTVFIGGGVTSFVNAAGGLIQNTDAGNSDYGGTAVAFNTGTLGGAVQSFVNNGTIMGASTNLTGQIGSTVGFFDGGNGPASKVGSFANTGLISGPGTGVSFDGGVTSGQNSGTISSVSNVAIYVGGADNTFTNSGTLTGVGGVDFNNDGSGGGNTFINSGKVIATDPNNYAAIGFFGSAADDTLRILTGSEIYGSVDFTGGDDTFDFSEFYGTTVLHVPGLENVVAGNRAYAFVSPDVIAIFDTTGATELDSVYVSSVGAIRNVLDQQLARVGTAGGDDDLLVNGYVAERPRTEAEAATAVMSDLSVSPYADPGGMTVWASAFGGMAQDNAPVDLTTTYGGLVVGTHAALNDSTTLGGLAAYSRSSFDVSNGQQTITSDTGILGVYGKSDLGVVTVDYSLLGGASSHASTRQVVALGVLQTATASFTSWFLSPEVGVELPLLSSAEGDLNVKASASYIGGGFSAYDETAPGGTVSVGAVGIGVWQGELELNGARVLSSNENGDVVLRGKVGLFAQANNGNSNIPITLLGTTISYTDPGTTAYGAFAGASVSAPLTDVVTLSAGVNGSVRSDGMTEASANVGISGDF